MSNESFPSRDLLEVIKGQERLAEKIDQFIKSQSELKSKVDTHDRDIAELKGFRRADKAYLAGAASVGGFGMGFVGAYLKSRMGL
jgi:hypothetical protein